MSIAEHPIGKGQSKGDALSGDLSLSKGLSIAEHPIGKGLSKGGALNLSKEKKDRRMLKVFVSLVLGPWGLKVLDFYIRNSAIINSIVFLYGVILVSAHVNYKKIVGDWLTSIEEDKKKKSRKKTYHIDWEKEISEHSGFPLIAGNTSLIPKKTSLENLLFYLAKDRKWKKAVDGLKINE